MTNASAAPRFVIVGNGVAGMEAGLAIRARRADAHITIVSEESDHHFARTALMWIHAGQQSHRDTEPYERDAYARHRFERVRARAVGVDVAERSLVLAGDRPPIPYDALLIACGSRAKPTPFPGGDLVGVGPFVTHQDLAWYEEELFGAPNREPPPNARAHLAASTDDSPYRFRPSAALARGRASRAPAVVGGGLIGLEAVELALARGLVPRFFFRDEWFWPSGLDRREADFVAENLARHGVLVHGNARIERLLGDEHGRVRAIRCGGDEVPADSVLVAIGVEANTGWLAGTPLARDPSGAILVDASLRTSAPGVFAAGDCAAIPRADGTHRAELLWYTARAQGRVVARAMLGEPARYEPSLPFNSAKLADLEHTSVGEVRDDVPGTRSWFFRETGRVRSSMRIVVEGDRVVGISLLGRRWDHEVFVEHIRAGRPLAYVLDHLGEAAFDTELVPPLVVPRLARDAPLVDARKGR